MKKFVNFRFIVTLVLAVFANVVTYAQDNVIDEVVWVVGDEAILKSDVEEARMDALYNGRRFEGDPYCVIPEEIAVQKLFLHQAKLDSIEVSEAEIIQRVDMMTNMYIQQIGSKEKMEEYFNKTATQIRETLRENARDGLRRKRIDPALLCADCADGGGRHGVPDAWAARLAPDGRIPRSVCAARGALVYGRGRGWRGGTDRARQNGAGRLCAARRRVQPVCVGAAVCAAAAAGQFDADGAAAGGK